MPKTLPGLLSRATRSRDHRGAALWPTLRDFNIYPVEGYFAQPAEQADPQNRLTSLKGHDEPRPLLLPVERAAPATQRALVARFSVFVVERDGDGRFVVERGPLADLHAADPYGNLDLADLAAIDGEGLQRPRVA